MLGIDMRYRVIYEPAGKALEYSPLALNVYRGCEHACGYCYSPNVLHMDREDFVHPQLRKGLLRKVKADAIDMERNRDTRNVLLSFTCDPYQQFDTIHHITRDALATLFEHGVHATVLTKGGRRSERDFDLLAAHTDLATYATTLVFMDDTIRERYEPRAAPMEERFAALKKAHDSGVPTWASLEPVYYPQQTFALVRKTHEYVDLYKVGRLNYEPEAALIDWHGFGHDIVALLESLGKAYYIKNDLRAAMVIDNETHRIPGKR